MKALIPIPDDNVHHRAPVSTEQGTRTTTLSTAIMSAIVDTREVHDVEGVQAEHLTFRFKHYDETVTLRFPATETVADVLKQLRAACQPRWETVEV